MKRCPTCNRTYTDPNLSFCIEDGTPLTEIPEEPAYLPPSAYVAPGPTPRSNQRRAWPWIVGIVGAFILGAVLLMIAAAVLVPRMVRSRQPNVPVVVNSDDREQAENVDSPVPTDDAQVLAQLTDIENEWTAANFNADKKKLDRILADDYVGPRAPPASGLIGKKEYLDEVTPQAGVDRWELTDLKVDLAGERATLAGKITYFAQGVQESFNFIDKFVWRNGRWQATGSEVQPTQ